MKSEQKNTKKKILYVITKSNFGGAQKYVYDLATSLPAEKFDVAVVLGGTGNFIEKLSEKKIRVIALSRLGRDVSIFNDTFVFFSLVKLFIHEKPDIVHLNSSKIGGLGTLAGRVYNFLGYLKAKDYRLKTNIVFTAHGWAFNESWRGSFSRLLIRALSWTTLMLSHQVITVSEKDYAQGLALPFSRKKLTAIHNGINPPRFLPREEARNVLLGSKAKSHEDALWIGTTAELTRNNAVENAIRAIYDLQQDSKKIDGGSASTQKFVYIILGDGEDKFRLANLITKLKLQNTVFLVGFKENAPSLLKAFDLFLMPALKAGLPYVLLEAGSAGLPVITTNVGGIPEIITDMQTGLIIRPQEVNELKKALSFALTHQKKMRALGRSLKKYITDNFSLKQMLEKTKSVYAK